MQRVTAPAFTQRSVQRPALAIDGGFYLGCAVFAALTAVLSEFYGFRVWGNFATVAYGIAALHAGWLLIDTRMPTSGWVARLRSRWTPLAVIAAAGMIAPLITLVIKRLTGVDWLITPMSWAAQPEVWVIERSASLLLETGSPYTDIAALDRAPVVNDYTPYGPSMTVFGLPRALLGDSAITDVRLVFALTAVLTVLGALWLLGWPKRLAFSTIPVRAAQLAVACPLTALTWAVAGPDLAILGLIVLATALAARDRPGWAAAVLAVVLSAKLTALPAVVVIAVLVCARLGVRALGTFCAVHLAGCALLNVPVYLAAPRAFAEHVVLFPAGLGMINSPAASPLPGYLIANTGHTGRMIALGMLGVAAVAITGWLLARPPRLGSDALLRIAVGLAAAILLTPATRWGYLVYPVALLGAALCFSVAERNNLANAHVHTARGNAPARERN
ncbi:MAG: DUF2029 domain-containing protein [Pseudonocardiaceae bacterium]|nr:DUF2029 domain-containing protein [Pseudonocardiaceae bacterium]